MISEPTASLIASHAPMAEPLEPPPGHASVTDALPVLESADGWAIGSGPPAAAAPQATRAERPSRRRESSGGSGSGPRMRPATEKPEERLGRVLGSYRLLDVLGRGGMGCVYRAEHIKLGRHVALKLLREDYARRRDAVSRFFQEARSVNRIRHRNIVDVTDFVELGDGTTYIIMELLDGVSLSKLTRSEQLTVPRALAVLIQICDGLSAAHGVGIIHRDLKPDNVIVVPTGDGADLVKLLDFGVAKLLYREDSDDFGWETAAGSVIGTPAYMSPEQAGGLTVDARSDIYSLGAIMYELFTGQPMFRARSFGEYVRKHLNERPPAPRQTSGGRHLDERIEAIILRCISKRPDERYPTVASLRAELLAVLGAIDTSIGDVRYAHEAALALHAAPTQAPLLPRYQSTHRASPSGQTGMVTPGMMLPSTGSQPGGDTAMSFGDVPRTVIRAGSPSWLPWAGGLAIMALAGGAIAFWVVSRTPDTLSPPRAVVPVAAAAQEPPAPVVLPVGLDEAEAGGEAARKSVVIRFDASPRGEVFVSGTDRPMCKTPCDVTIDPRDGGDPRERHFVIRRPGYVDEPVGVDLAAPRDTGVVRLRRRAGAETSAAETAHLDERSPAPPTSDPGDGGEPAAPEVPAAVPEKATAKPPPATAPSRRPPKPPSGSPTRPPTKIDPADTLDPFRGK